MSFVEISPLSNTMNRKLIIAGGVLVVHVAALWALQAGLLRRPVELIVPAEILVEFITPAAPALAPPVVARATPAPAKPVVAKVPAPVRTPTPLPRVMADATPAPTAPTDAPQTPVAPTPKAASAPAAIAAVAPTASSPPRIELPSSGADYLQNPKPAYPALSKRLGEQGKVLVRILIGVDGTAQKTELKQSSGYDRLDQTALATVLRWRYVPGTRAGIPEAMWFTVPVNFVLE